MRTGYLIQYDNRGVIYVRDGKRVDVQVGEVYVERIPWLEDGYSYTKDPAAATVWGTEHHALMAIRGHKWPAARPVPVETAPVLPPERSIGVPA